MAIRDHYVGPAAVNHCVAEMEAKLDCLSWSNKVQFPFGTYISHMSECFQDLEGQDEHIMERAKAKPNAFTDDIQGSTGYGIENNSSGAGTTCIGF